MYERELAKDLVHFTSLVLSAAKGKISLSEFVKNYRNFYYRYALDGHEADAEQREALGNQRIAIEFHKRVQTEVLNSLYLVGEENEASIESARRIGEDEAVRRLGGLCSEYGAEEIVNQLEE